MDDRLGVILNGSKSTTANEQHQMQVATSRNCPRPRTTGSASALADVAVLYTGPPLPEEGGELEYQRSRSTSADVDAAGMDDRPRRRAH